MSSPAAASPDARIDIAFGFDEGYAPHVAAVIASITRRAPAEALRFLLLNTGVSPASRARIEATAPGARFIWIQMGKADLPAFSGERKSLAHVNETSLLRLALGRIAPADCQRVIYLDADLIVTGDIRKLWQVDLEGRPVGAVEDCFLRGGPFAQKWNLPSTGMGYFNAGVLVIDLAKVRAGGMFDRAMQFVMERNPPFADQDALNWAFHGQWKRLEDTWNVQRHMTIAALEEELLPHQKLAGRAPGIVHFTGPEKPWLRKGYHPWTWLYWRALHDTPFESDVRRKSGVTLVDMMRIRLRWMRRHPTASRSKTTLAA